MIKTTSFKQTGKFARLLVGKIVKKKSKNALILALSGDLGSGKTTFAKGFIKSAGVKSKITSPTFTLIKNYSINKSPYYKKIYHIDCYRVKKTKELFDLGLKEILSNSKNIVLIEWPEKIKKSLPKNYILIKFKHGRKENERIIKITE